MLTDAEPLYCLQEFALSTPGKCPEASDVLARDTLALLRKRPEPDVAAALLSEVGLLRRHEPLPLLRAGRSVTDCDPTVEAAAQVCCLGPLACSRGLPGSARKFQLLLVKCKPLIARQIAGQQQPLNNGQACHPCGPACNGASQRPAPPSAINRQDHF